MNIIKIDHIKNAPVNFTGIVFITLDEGQEIWYLKEGLLHREDGPAREFPDGTKYWCKKGGWHREDGPALEYPNGHKEWYKDGMFHREDGPAIEYTDGDKSWYLGGIGYLHINLSDHIVLDHYKGKYNILWYRILDKDKIIEYPDIPGLITK